MKKLTPLSLVFMFIVLFLAACSSGPSSAEIEKEKAYQRYLGMWNQCFVMAVAFSTNNPSDADKFVFCEKLVQKEVNDDYYGGKSVSFPPMPAFIFQPGYITPTPADAPQG